ncbi:hypothetical protein ThrDRAFT_03647 [Frankia casuarinae]|jgi:hypothetical protein|uniref:Uncharacterized protein n=2 Tax=Frankia TaxID=1854 RepID=Q2J5B8_FRACC|nr:MULTISPECIES: hypothetical protein [Frankia]ETA00911.1 hypothetical protein CcI6DRAFT_03673 [Frankia sp. CcI6]ORT47409.1 hypothetical protein KBI5_19865 [Frankia sp. KB5]ABD13524.1 hypothetical protein Francci3_4176 [Frankia casuarinae]EYT90711.1 hypothetical protein ThrDRAFT_03647 [Frankia casuarinae]KDA41459.1 hypothetical protein BMG523Draft_03718 [Frankia sp. BMG5.23]
MTAAGMASLLAVAAECEVDSGTARLGRAVVFASSSVCLAWAAHVSGGAPRPAAGIMLVAVLLLTRVAFGLADRERGVAALLAGLGATQIALHVTFVLAHPHTHLASGPSLDVPMTAAHGIAVGCVGLMLRHSERAVWCAAGLRPRTVVALLLYPVTVAVVPPVPPTVKINLRKRVPRPHARPLGRGARRRGPPASPFPGLTSRRALMSRRAW